MIIGKDTMLPINFLEKAINCSRAVGRILCDKGMGTGFILSGELLVTCHSVIPDIKTASSSRFQIDYFVKTDGTFNNYTELKLDPDKFFATSKDLDVTAVRIKQPEAMNLTERYIGHLQLSNLVVGESVNIIHHALGEPQKISMRSGKVLMFTDNLFQYDTPTSPGSTGAPVFNDQWELIGIHHAAKFFPSPDIISSPERFNEGIRISAVTDWFKSVSDSNSVTNVADTKVISKDKVELSSHIFTAAENQTEVDAEIRDSVFISYAHKDQQKVEWQVELDKYVKNVSVIGQSRVWYDERIKVGGDWRLEISAALKKTKVAVLLIGPYFLNSDFIINKELPDILEAAQNGGVKIIPVITHRVPYHRSFLSSFQSFNSPDKPLDEQSKKQAIKTLNEVVEEIAKAYDVK